MKRDPNTVSRRHWMMLSGGALAMAPGAAEAQQSQQPNPNPTDAELDKVLPDQLLLKDYRPKSVYRIPVSSILKAKYPAIDCHHHARVRTPEDVEDQVKIMDAANVETTCAFSTTGEQFDHLAKLFSKYPKRFQVWCGLDMKGVDQPGFGPATAAELERCHKLGAVGVGEITDKGMGIGGVLSGASNWQGTRPAGGGGQGPQNRPPVQGLHPDDPKMDAIWQKCADFGMPIELHMSDPYWGYQKQDRYNDGLMNGFSWRYDNKTGIMRHEGLIQSLDQACKRHPKTVFMACHLANLDYDLTHLGQMLQSNPNLYADLSARFCETATIPRFTAQFLQKWAHRIVYGTDIPYSQHLFSLTYRILESTDEHFYDQDFYFNFNYHWPMYGMGLSDDILKKVYRDTALNAFKQARSAARG